MGLWSVCKSSTLLSLPPLSFPCFSAGSLHGLQSFQSRSSVSPLDGLQFLRISLLQHWSFTGCSSCRAWPPAPAWSPHRAAEWITAPSQLPSMGCRGNSCCGAWRAFSRSSLSSVLQDSFSHFCFPHSVPVQNLALPAVLPSQLCPVVTCWVPAVHVCHGAALASCHRVQPVNPHCHLHLVLRKLRKTGRFYTKLHKRGQNPEK